MPSADVLQKGNLSCGTVAYLFVREGVFMGPDKYPPPTDFEIPI